MEFKIRPHQKPFRTFNFFQYEKKINEYLLQELPPGSYPIASELRLSTMPLQNSKESLLHRNRTIFEVKMSDLASASIAAKIIPNSCEIPLESSSLDLFYHAHLFSRLRMDQVYMICAEARRIVRVNGIWAIIDHSPGKNVFTNFGAKAWEKILAHRNLELTHYISPEDWEVVVDRKICPWGITSQILILRRV